MGGRVSVGDGADVRRVQRQLGVLKTPSDDGAPIYFNHFVLGGLCAAFLEQRTTCTTSTRPRVLDPHASLL